MRSSTRIGKQRWQPWPVITLEGARRAQMIGYADGIDDVEQDAEAMSLNQ